MRPGSRTPSSGRAFRRLLSLVILALPGGHHGGILPGVEVDRRHRWAIVCDKCVKVVKTQLAQQSKNCDACGSGCRTLRLFLCGCGRVLIYDSDEEAKRGVKCENGSHDPRPRFVGTPRTRAGRSFDFTSEGAS
ncbi:Hypothetical protein AJAP_23095 [Amycolatopsis japonica]|uniref:Uncharacterized protein n=1 Tax=Amycolatopsis japonica TaxID=208439 RepID=A0A075UTE8_9PSEU|nr:Hypothetical protein AJAP_23095 [Amycolatopsis japonica]